MTSSASRRLKRAIARLRRSPAYPPVDAGLSSKEFQAVADERLRNLERQLDEVKMRVNGLIFMLAGTVAAQVILRLFG
jgi:hypothetical protein